MTSLADSQPELIHKNVWKPAPERRLCLGELKGSSTDENLKHEEVRKRKMKTPKSTEALVQLEWKKYVNT